MSRHCPPAPCSHVRSLSPYDHWQPALCPIRRRHRRHQCHCRRRHRRSARTQDQGTGCAQWHPGRLARGVDRYLQGIRCSHCRIGADPRRRFRLVPLQAQIAGGRQRQVRTSARRAARARRALVPLQRRQRLGRHRVEGLATRKGLWLPAALHRRAKDHRQRSGGDRHLPWLRLGGQVHRRLGTRGRTGCRRHGRHLHQGLHL